MASSPSPYSSSTSPSQSPAAQSTTPVRASPSFPPPALSPRTSQQRQQPNSYHESPAPPKVQTASAKTPPRDRSAEIAAAQWNSAQTPFPARPPSPRHSHPVLVPSPQSRFLRR